MVFFRMKNEFEVLFPSHVLVPVRRLEMKTVEECLDRIKVRLWMTSSLTFLFLHIFIISSFFILPRWLKIVIVIAIVVGSLGPPELVFNFPERLQILQVWMMVAIILLAQVIYRNWW